MLLYACLVGSTIRKLWLHKSLLEGGKRETHSRGRKTNHNLKGAVEKVKYIIFFLDSIKRIRTNDEQRQGGFFAAVFPIKWCFFSSSARSRRCARVKTRPPQRLLESHPGTYNTQRTLARTHVHTRTLAHSHTRTLARAQRTYIRTCTLTYAYAHAHTQAEPMINWPRRYDHAHIQAIHVSFLSPFFVFPSASAALIDDILMYVFCRAGADWRICLMGQGSPHCRHLNAHHRVSPQRAISATTKKNTEKQTHKKTNAQNWLLNAHTLPQAKWQRLLSFARCPPSSPSPLYEISPFSVSCFFKTPPRFSM